MIISSLILICINSDRHWREPELRVQIVTQRSEFDENPATFRKAYNDSQNALTNRIVEARQLVKQVCVVFENKCC